MFTVLECWLVLTQLLPCLSVDLVDVIEAESKQDNVTLMLASFSPTI